VKEKSFSGCNMLTSDGHLEWTATIEVMIVNRVKAGAEKEK
jgi:hypothetical protein